MAKTKIYLREEQQENYEEDDYNIDIHVTKNGTLIIGSEYKYRRDFRIGDIVTINNIDFGYVYKINPKGEEVKVEWGYSFNDWENNIDLLIIPSEYGVQALDNTAKRNHTDSAVKGWLKLINGYKDNTDEYLLDKFQFPSVHFIKYIEDILYDEKIDRKITLYREIGKYKVYKASVYNGEELRSWDTVFYILDTETKKVFWGGLNDEIRVTLAIIYNKVET